MKTAEHSIFAFYSNMPGPEMSRVLQCSCGFDARAKTWEDAGREMDEHIDSSLTANSAIVLS